MTEVTRLTLEEDGSIKSCRFRHRRIPGDGGTLLETVGQDLRAARFGDLQSINGLTGGGQQ